MYYYLIIYFTFIKNNNYCLFVKIVPFSYSIVTHNTIILSIYSTYYNILLRLNWNTILFKSIYNLLTYLSHIISAIYTNSMFDML